MVDVNMKLIVCVLTLVVSILGAPNPDVRIIGGRDAERGQFTSIVSLQFCSFGACRHSCGGTIISPSWILTAGHCQTEAAPSGNFSVLAGVLNLDENIEEREMIDVVERIVYPDYVSGAAPHDLALFKTVTPLVYNKYVQPMKLPQQGAEFSGNSTLVGWGTVDSDETVYPKTLKTLNVSILPILECDSDIDSLLPSGIANPLNADYNICTNNSGGVAFCSGDSGGPLIEDGQVIGIVSWTLEPCGYAPSVYVKVSNYTDWIRDTIDEDLI